MKLKRQPLHRFQRVLLALCVVLSAYTIYELFRPQQASEFAQTTEQDTQTIAALLQQAGVDIPPIETFVEIIERPLFMQDRRPYVAPAPVVIREPEPQAPAAPDITEQISLRATIIIGEKRIALIQELANGSQLRLNQGEAYNGWTLTGVETGEISMKKGEEVKQIQLKKGQS